MTTLSNIYDAADERVKARFVTAANNPRVPAENDRVALHLIESAVMSAAMTIELYAPDGRLKSLALTNLEETLTWANKAIYVHGVQPGSMTDVSKKG